MKGTELRRAAICTAGALGLSILFFAPRLWLMQTYLPGTFGWDRAHSFLLQCESPFRRDVEVSVLWRQLPPLVCNLLGLRGWAAFTVPWAGAIFATFYVAHLASRRLSDPRFVLGTTILFATTAAVLVPVGWLGMNDGWIWIGLLGVAFAESQWAVIAACLFCPWVDERFIIGLPLALAVRFSDAPERFHWRTFAPLLGLLPYTVLRLTISHYDSTGDRSLDFLKGAFRAVALTAPWAPIAWWMGLRVAWLPIYNAVRSRPWLLGGGALTTLLVCLFVATDMSRSTAILSPLLLLGVFQFAASRPDLAPRTLLTVGIANLLIPAAHVTFTKFDRIDNLAIELYRVLHR